MDLNSENGDCLPKNDPDFDESDESGSFDGCLVEHSWSSGV